MYGKHHPNQTNSDNKHWREYELMAKKEWGPREHPAREILLVVREAYHDEYADFIHHVEDRLRDARFHYVKRTFRFIPQPFDALMSEVIKKDDTWAGIVLLPINARQERITHLSIFERDQDLRVGRINNSEELTPDDLINRLIHQRKQLHQRSREGRSSKARFREYDYDDDLRHPSPSSRMRRGGRSLSPSESRRDDDGRRTSHSLNSQPLPPMMPQAPLPPQAPMPVQQAAPPAQAQPTIPQMQPQQQQQPLQGMQGAQGLQALMANPLALLQLQSMLVQNPLLSQLLLQPMVQQGTAALMPQPQQVPVVNTAQPIVTSQPTSANTNVNPQPPQVNPLLAQLFSQQQQQAQQVQSVAQQPVQEQQSQMPTDPRQRYAQPSIPHQPPSMSQQLMHQMSNMQSNAESTTTDQFQNLLNGLMASCAGGSASASTASPVHGNAPTGSGGQQGRMSSGSAGTGGSSGTN